MNTGIVNKNYINVVNLHITDFCNFNCKHCFVKKEGKQLSLDESKKCVDKIAEFFEKTQTKEARINIAGGEPLLYPHLKELVDHIYSKHISISLITNGVYVTENMLNKFYDPKRQKSKIDMIGISIDGLTKQQNTEIGRYSGTTIPDENYYIQKCKIIKNAGIKLKINICVGKYNVNTDFSNLLNETKPDRLKLLKMSIQDMNQESKSQEITDAEFDTFCNKYKKYGSINENSDDISNSYLIIDSKGCVSTENGHTSNLNLLQSSLDTILKNFNLDYKTFYQRYN